MDGKDEVSIHSVPRQDTAECSISVIVPVHNGMRTIEDCLLSIRHGTEMPYEVIVVDDHSSDGTTELLAGQPWLETFSTEHVSGPAVARNMGAGHATGDILVFVDADVVLPAEMITRLREIFQSNPCIAAVQTVYEPVCPPPGVFSRYQNFFYFHSMHSRGSGPSAIFATYCAAVRRNLFIDIGGFNTDIPEPTVEDEEFGYTLADSDHTILLDTDLRVKHLASYTLTGFIRRRFRMARTQAKSVLRSLHSRGTGKRSRLWNRGTHHDPSAVVAMLLALPGALLLGICMVLTACGRGTWPLLPLSLLLVLAPIPIRIRFLSNAAHYFFDPAIPVKFATLVLLDSLVLGFGLAAGTVEFVLGKRY